MKINILGYEEKVNIFGGHHKNAHLQIKQITKQVTDAGAQIEQNKRLKAF